MIKILQARLQQKVNWELPGVQAGFRKGRGTRDQIANIRWIIEKAREFQKTSTSASLTMLMSQLIRSDPDAGNDWSQEKGMTEDEMVGWLHRLNGREFEQAPGVGDGPGSLACCSQWGHKMSDMTERLNWTELNRNIIGDDLQVSALRLNFLCLIIFCLLVDAMLSYFSHVRLCATP